MSFPRVWLKSTYDLITTSEIRDGDIAVDLAAATPRLMIWKDSTWHVAVQNTAQVTIVANDPLGLSSLVGLELTISTSGNRKKFELKYQDGEVQRTLLFTEFEV